MLIVFQSIIPIFLAIFVGNGLRKLSSFSDEFWFGLERLCFVLLYPVLLFVTVYRADFSGLSLGKIVVALSVALAVMSVLTLAMWPILKQFNISAPTFSSIFQSTIRWNGFVALVIAENMFPPEAVALVGLVMAAIVVPINVLTVAVLAWFTDSQPNFGSVFRRVLTNPIIIGTALGIGARYIPGGVPGFLLDGLQLIARAAIGMGLLTIGAGLRLESLFKPSLAVYLPTFLKLVVFPVLVISIARLLGVEGNELIYLALCASMPTAMNGYILARQMGGDAENYAITVTLQTVIAFFSIPAALAISGQLTGG